MKRIIFLEQLSPWGKLILLLGLIIISSLLSAFTGLLIGKLYLGVDFNTLSGYIADPQTPSDIAFLKLYQLINQLGVFIFPIIIFSYLVSPNMATYLNMNRKPRLISLLIAGLVVYAILPFNQYILDLNQNLNLPKIFSGLLDWMKEYEAKAESLTEACLKTDSAFILFVNLFIVAIVPAIGEEWLFRGVLLKLFKQLTGNYHWSVLITAFLFAALHLQFMSFLPRFFLGILLGYLFVLTRNLWVPIFAHFINNASSVIIFYLHYNKIIKVSADDFGASANTVYIIGSFLITVWLCFILYNKERFNFKA
jgi:uncharacterized protein